MSTHRKIVAVTFNALEACLHAGMPPDKDMQLKLKDDFVGIVCNFIPKHNKNKLYEK